MADPVFRTPSTNPFGLTNVTAHANPSLVDIDGDGDLDAFIGHWYGDTLFYRNSGTADSPAFDAPATNPFGLTDVGYGASPTFADIDGDGDLDAFVGNGYYGGHTLFYRNTGTAGSPAFDAASTDPFGLTDVGSYASPTFADIDGDGDLDAFVGNSSGNTLFYRNIGTAVSPIFDVAGTDPFGLTDVGSRASPTFADIDSDGDLDAFVNNSSGNTLFYRNTGTTGNPVFDVASTNSFGLTDVGSHASPTFADIDNDGDLDAFVGNSSGNTLFYRNDAIAAPNNAPTATNLDQTIVYTEDTTAAIVDIVVSDANVTDILTATVTLAGGNSAIGSLSANSGNGETYNAATGAWTVTGTQSTVNAALAAMSFAPTANGFASTSAAISISDGVAPAVTGTLTFNGTAVSDAPTLTTVSTLLGAVENQPYTISYTNLAAAADEADGDGDLLAFRIEAVSSGTLTKNGTAVTVGVTTLAVDESLVWTPVGNPDSILDAFTVVAVDSSGAASASPVPVRVGGSNATYITTSDNVGPSGVGVPDNDMDQYLYDTDIEFLIPVTQNLSTLSSAVLSIYGYDVDEESGERDAVYFNNVKIGYLSGTDSTWTTTTFNITPSLVTANNLVSITVDEDNTGWAVQVDWGQLLINGGGASYGKVDSAILTHSSINNGTVSLTTTAGISVTATGTYKVEVNLVDATGNKYTSNVQNFTATTTGNYSYDIVSDYAANTNTKDFTVEVNLFYIDATNTPLQQNLKTVTFHHEVNVGPMLPPTLTTVSTLSGAAEDQPFTISYADLATSADEADANSDALSFQIEAVSSGMLTKDGTAVMAGVTTLASGENLVWTPDSNANGTINAFTVVAKDPFGAVSSSAVPVRVETVAVNDVPTDILLGSNSIAENSANGILIGTLFAGDPDVGDTHTYQLLDNTGGRFALDGNLLKVADGSLLNYEQSHSHTVTLQTTDAAGLSYSKQLTIYLNNVNESPIDISLSQYNVDENNQNGTIVGVLSTTDTDSFDSHTYQLIDNAGGRFAIVNNQLQVADGALLDFESNSSHVIRVRTTDNGGLSVEKDLTIAINNIDADLVAGQIAITPLITEVEAGTAFDVSWTLINQGEATFNGSWTDKVYLDDPNTPELDRLVGDYAFSGEMPLGTPLERIQTLPVPSNLLGNYRVVVVTDAYNQINEGATGEINNTTLGTQSISIVPMPMPNLQVSTVTVPASAFTGRPIEVQWTVSNTGTAATTTPVWNDGLWLSADNLFDNTDVYLGSASNPAYLDVGQSYTNSATVTLPHVEGDYHVLVKADSSGQVVEGGLENDNVRASSTLSVQPIPIAELSDLAVISVAASDQSFSGQRLNLTYTIDNAGQAAIAASNGAEWLEQIYMSADAVLDAGDRLLQTVSRDLNADTLPKPNNATHFTATESVVLPVAVEGDFTFFVRVAPIAPVSNVFTSNDVGFDSTPTVVHLTPPPDLQVSAINSPATGLAGHSLDVSYQVHNAGLSGTPNTNWTDTLYLSSDTVWDAGDVKLADLGHSGALQLDTSYSNNATVTLPNGIAGTFYLITSSDSKNDVLELDNTNNILTSTPITVDSRPADLIVNTVIMPSAAQAGKSVRIDWGVSNQGAGDSIVSDWNDAIIASSDTVIGNGDDVLLAQFAHQGVLNTGDSYNRSELVTLPNNLAGHYAVFAVTDYDNRVYEASQENNNSRAVSSDVAGADIVEIVVIPAKPSDLQVTTVAAPLTADSGQALTVAYTVTNTSNKTDTNYWNDRITLSTDTVLGNADDVIIDTVGHYSALDFNQDYQVSRTVTLPNDLQGTFNVFVTTDADNWTGEGAQENNNIAQAANTMTVALSAMPDLVVSQLDAVNLAVSGQNLALTWTVQNNGAATGQGYRSVFYLSRDQILDRGSDVYLGYADSSGLLAAGATVSASESLHIPNGMAGSYHVFAVVDSSNAIYERSGENNNVTRDSTPVAISLPPLTDLVAGTITVPANGVPGQQASITYTVSNQSAANLNSSWQDSLYLSRDALWDVNDLLFARVDISQSLNAGDSYTQTVNGDLPGVIAGDYQLIVRSDIRNVIAETNEVNNLTASVNAVTLDVERLTLGTTDIGTIDSAHSVYYRVDVAAGETLRVNFDSVSTTGRTELFISHGEMPSQANFDYRYTQADSPDQRIVIPNTQAGTYYILAHNAVGATSDYTIGADVLQFGIEDLSIDQGSNKGLVTVRINGAEFTTHTAAQLLDSDGVAHSASQVLWKDGTEIWATFDLRGMATGAYDVKLTDDTHTALLNDGFTVITGELGHVEYGMETPPALRTGQQGSVRVYYKNTGDTDVSAPLLTVSGNALLKLAQDADFSGSSMQFLGISSEGPAGTLAPGAEGSFELVFKADFAGAGTVNLGVSSLAGNETMDWAAILENSKPDNIDPGAWASIKANLIQQLGTSTGDYQAALAENATQLSALENSTNSVSDLFGMAFLRATHNGALLQNEDIGVLGRGRSFDWDISATEQDNGDVIVSVGGVQQRFVHQTDGSYSSDGTTGLSKQDGAFTLRQQDGGQIAFNADGSFNAIIDSNGNALHATYTAGQLSQVVSDQGDSQSFTYNAQGRLTGITDQNGHATGFAYDANAEYVTGITTVNGTTQYSYVGTGSTQQVSAITLPDGTVKHFDYDSQGRLIKESVNTDQQVTTYEYVSVNEVLVKDSLGNASHLWLNERGQIAQVENALGKVTQLHYDTAGNLTGTVNPDGTISQLTYNSDNNPLSVQDALGNTVSFGYNGQNGQLAGVTDQRGNPISYSYDAHNNLNGITYADGSTERYSYDADGNLNIAVNRRGDGITYTYDAKGQLLQKTYADNSTATYSYDAHGNLLQATDADSSTGYQYDSNDRLTKVTDGDGRWLSYLYDATGRKVHMVDSAGHTTNYSYNSQGQLARLSDAGDNTIASYQYDNDGRLSRGDNGNGTYTTYEYDAANQLTHLINFKADGTVNSRFDYTYNDMGQRTAMTTLDGTTSYSYDAIGQLTGVTLPDGHHIDYRYDAAGNRITVADNGVSTDYSTNDLNQYSTVGNASYSYDADGNLTGKTDNGVTTAYAYDVENRLISVTTPGDAWQYEYDALGNRIASVHNGERVEYQLDPTGLVNVAAEYDGITGALLDYFQYGLGLETLNNQNGSSYYDFDALGSTAGLTNTVGAYLNSYSYLPFGENLITSEVVANPFEYVGQWGVMDAGNGLDFMRARFYSEDEGRFVSADPIGINGGLNSYNYANGNPITFNDPNGLKVQVNGSLTKYNEAKDYLSKDPGMARIFADIENSSDTYTVNFTNPLFDNGLYDPDTKTISWNPYGWLETTSGGTQSPAMILGHEMTHAHGDLQGLLNNIQKLNNDYDNTEERRVINGPEADAARILGESVRSDHRGSFDFAWGEIIKDIIFDAAIEYIFQGVISPESIRSLFYNISKDIPIIAPRDPNDILHPEGFGADHWLTANQALPYTIRFENQATATAPAQQVTITEKLDSDLDLRSFRLGDFGWGDITIDVPDNVAVYVDRLDLTATQGFMVDVVAGIDVAKGEIFWSLTTIDPNTGEIPTDPNIGFLPTNVTKGTGEGFVNYFIKPSATVTTGTVIDAQATIIFTGQEPIDTPHVFNTLDTQLPSSFVTVGPATAAGLLSAAIAAPVEMTVNSAQFLVRWSGDDTGSGLAGYSVYVSDNGADYQPWLEQTTLTEATYGGLAGHNYAFYTVATDNAGNREAAPTQADLQVTVASDAVLTDTTAPVIASVVLPSNAYYALGQTLDISVQFTEKVFVDISTLAPSIALVLGTTNSAASYVSGSGSNTLVFRHTVQTGEFDIDGIGLANTIDLNNSVLRDEAGNIALDLAFTAGATTGIKIDNAPTGAPKTIGINEDSAYSFSSADFGYADIDGNALASIKITSLPGAGSLTLSGAAIAVNQVVTAATISNLSFSPAANVSGGGYAAFNFSVNDGSLDSVSTHAISFNVAAVNDAPTGANKTITLNEDSAYNFSPADFGYADIESNAMASVKITGLPNAGALKLSGAAVAVNQIIATAAIANLSFTPVANASGNGYANFNFSVNDGSLDSVSANAISLNVMALSDVPVGTATASLVAGTEDTAYTVTAVNLLSGFSDADGDALSVTGLTANHGTVVNNNNGTFTITPTANYNGALGLTYNVIDGNGGSIAATQSFTLAAANDAPTGTATAVLTAGTEDTAYTVSAVNLLSGFSDIDGDSLSVTGLAANHGTVVNNNNGTFSITPAANYNGAVGLTYNVIDGNGGSVGATQSFTLSASNNAPTGIATAVLTAGTEDTAYTVSAVNLLSGFSDADGDSLSVISLAANHGTVINNNKGTFTITPTANYNGTLGLTYNVIDGNGGSIAATQSVTLAASNDAPTGTATAVLTAGTEDTAYTVSAVNLLSGFSDIDGDSLSVTSLAANHGTVVNNNNGTFTITPAANYNGALGLTYNVIDGNGGRVAGTQSFNLAAVNDLPTGTVSITGTATQGQILTAGNNLVDADGVGAITYQWKAGGVAISGAVGTTYTLSQAEVGKAITVTASYTDAQLNAESVVSTATAAVIGMNNAPVITSGGIGSIAENAAIATVIYTATATDVDANDTLSYSLKAAAGDEALLSINAGTGAVTLKSSANFEAKASYSFTVVSTDAGGLGTEQAVVVSVTDVNDAPTLTALASTVADGNEDSRITVTFANLKAQGDEADVDGTVKAFVIKDLSSGTLAIGTSASAATAWNATTNNIVDATHKAYWTPDANANGSVDAFTVVAKDGEGAESAAAIQATVAVTAVNDAPTLTAFASTVADGNEDSRVTVTLGMLKAQGNEADVDGTVSSFVIKSLNSGTLNIGTSASVATAWNAATNNTVDATHKAYWTPAANTSGSLDAFTVVAKDGEGAESAAAIQATVAVTAVNDAPTLTDFASTVSGGNEDSRITVTFANLKAQGNEADVDGTVSAFVIKDLSSGTLTIGTSASAATAWNATTNNIVDATRKAYWTPDKNANGSVDAFTVVAKDNEGTESAVAIQATMAVTAVNDKPTLATPSVINYTDTALDDVFALVTGSLIASDVDGNTLTYGITDGADKGDGTISMNSTYGVLTVNKATGAYSFAANDAVIETLGVDVSDSFTVTSSDGLISTGKSLIINITQSGATETVGNDLLVGTKNNDVINGLAGADKMKGGLGNDVYFVDNVGDVVTETSALSSEIDTVNSKVNFTLGTNLENLILTGTTAISGTGNALNNVLTGNAGANKLNGGAGNDILNGGLSNDILTGGAGNDIFQLTNISKDTIKDFVVADDTIQLENEVFTKLTTTGVLKAANFKIGIAAADANDYLIYNSKNGALLYDIDGNGAELATQIAVLGVNLALTNADFGVI